MSAQEFAQKPRQRWLHQARRKGTKPSASMITALRCNHSNQNCLFLPAVEALKPALDLRLNRRKRAIDEPETLVCTTDTQRPALQNEHHTRPRFQTVYYPWPNPSAARGADACQLWLESAIKTPHQATMLAHACAKSAGGSAANHKASRVMGCAKPNSAA